MHFPIVKKVIRYNEHIHSMHFEYIMADRDRCSQRFPESIRTQSLLPSRQLTSFLVGYHVNRIIIIIIIIIITTIIIIVKVQYPC